MKHIYFDYAATTPLDPQVRAAMLPYFSDKFGNPSSLHSFGQEAIAAIDHSREIIAKSIGADFREIIFTGSATGANNLALRGAVKAHQRITNQKRINKFVNSKKIRYSLIKPRLIVSAIEHESILETARDLEKDEAEVVYLSVDRKGIVNLKELESALDERTILVSVMHANNETGAIQPIAEIAKITESYKSNRTDKTDRVYPLLHADVVQAFQFMDCNVRRLGVDLMTLSAHKIYGPKGVGALYIRDNERWTMNDEPRATNSKQESKKVHSSKFIVHPLITGGGQEFGFRSGTENVPAIVGFGKAAELVSDSREPESKRIGKLRDYFWEKLKKICPQAQINGILSTNSEFKANMRIRKFEKDSLFADMLPNILNVYFPDYQADELLTKLDLAGIAASSGSACSSRASEPSYVIQALGYSKERAARSLRFSFGRPTTKAEVDKTLEIIKKLLR